ncbi:hypothetical protein KV557_40470 [Kitasatospora aureofaciens]|uniref:hypothetical protein n=1 Tax=Kitasatospora aureofaciens TaxID=1894 RepID=UPI001C44AAA7|nr:hypothetical protein [Kitasatospora aureofaciens]MBV6703291.1 hypothetical protein [Kitasatospora aureofaciens]
MDGQAVAEGAIVMLGLPIGHSITAKVAQVPYGRPGAGFTTLASSSPLMNASTPVDGSEHVELRGALDTIARVLTRRLDDAPRAEP